MYDGKEINKYYCVRKIERNDKEEKDFIKENNYNIEIKTPIMMK